MNDLRILDTSVTSSTMRLRGAEISYDMDFLIEEEPVPGKFAATDAQTEVQFMGWTNPVYSIRGYVDESSDKLTSGITLSLLKQYAKSTGSTYIYDDELCSSGAQIKIKRLNLTKRATDKESSIYQYNITAVETL